MTFNLTKDMAGSDGRQTRILHSASSLEGRTSIGTDAPDIDAFMHAWCTLDGNCAFDMDLSNREWTLRAFL